jgi:hypothetical protein
LFLLFFFSKKKKKSFAGFLVEAALSTNCWC